MAPGLANFDLSAYKEFAIAEGKRLEFRAEFFNAFNRPNFADSGLDFGTGDVGVITPRCPDATFNLDCALTSRMLGVGPFGPRGDQTILERADVSN